MLYGLEEMTKLLEAELGILQILFGVSWMDRIHSKSIRETAQGGGFENTIEREARMRWWGHVIESYERCVN